MLTCLHTFFTTNTVFRIFKKDMLVPQKTNFTYDLLRAFIDTLPTGFTIMCICPNMSCNFLEFFH